jgi:hypothetical protein
VTSDITRRDFLNGVALTIAAGLMPLGQVTWAEQAPYPPALTGLRGSHDGVIEVAHQLGKSFSIDTLPDDETYDLVVVGAGLAGLAAAWFYRFACILWVEEKLRPAWVWCHERARRYRSDCQGYQRW